MKIQKILVSQPKPETEKSPYFDLAKKYKLEILFRPFIKVEGISATEFRQERINIVDHTAVIFTSKNAADHFFRMCTEMRITVPESMKYFCISEGIAFYLQKFVQFRKRKIFHGKQTFNDLTDLLKKHKEEKFLLPCTDVHKEEVAEYLQKNKMKFTKAILYRTVASNMKDIKNLNEYDIIAFFSPSGIKSLHKNFPKFKQGRTKIAAFGPTTAKAVVDAKLKLNIQVPNPEAPSMAMALENFIKESIKEERAKAKKTK